MELYVLGKSSGTLWNFLMCFMERNNYATIRSVYMSSSVLEGDKTGGLGTEVPQWSRSRALVEVWGRSTQKVETYMLITIAIMC